MRKGVYAKHGPRVFKSAVKSSLSRSNASFGYTTLLSGFGSRSVACIPLSFGSAAGIAFSFLPLLARGCVRPFREFVRVERVPGFFNDLEAEIPHLRRYALFLTKSRENADDLTQACLERAISRAHLWQEGTNLRAWLFKIMYNLFISERRSAARVVRMNEAADLSGESSTQASQHHAVELGRVGDAIDAMPEEQRSVLILVVVEGMTYEEVAETMDIPVGTVRSRLSRAREAMRLKFGDSETGQTESRDEQRVRPRNP